LRKNGRHWEREKPGVRGSGECQKVKKNGRVGGGDGKEKITCKGQVLAKS